MNTLLQELPLLQQVLTAAAAAAPAGTVDVGCVDRYVRGIRRKCLFVSTHLLLLQSVDWTCLDDLGRQPGPTGAASTLTIALRDVTIELRHPSAVVDHVFLAADGLFAAVANLTDTFARLVNAVFSLGEQERTASFARVVQRCSPTSALRTVMDVAQHKDWLVRVRDLRGRCQHADVEEILPAGAVTFGRYHEPAVPMQYCWQVPASSLPLTAYAYEAAAAAEATLLAAVRAIITCPGDPTR